MDEKVDEVVTEDIKLSKIVIEGKGKVGKKTDGVLISMSR